MALSRTWNAINRAGECRECTRGIVAAAIVADLHAAMTLSSGIFNHLPL
jgi:hypothetical protein